MHWTSFGRCLKERQPAEFRHSTLCRPTTYYQIDHPTLASLPFVSSAAVVLHLPPPSASGPIATLRLRRPAVERNRLSTYFATWCQMSCTTASGVRRGSEDGGRVWFFDVRRVEKRPYRIVNNVDTRSPTCTAMRSGGSRISDCLRQSQTKARINERLVRSKNP